MQWFALIVQWLDHILLLIKVTSFYDVKVRLSDSPSAKMIE